MSADPISQAERDAEIVRLRTALTEAHQFAVVFMAFNGRDRGTARMETTLDGLLVVAGKVDEAARAALTPVKGKPCSTLGPTCRGCPDCQGIPFDAETDEWARQELSALTEGKSN